MTTPQDFYDALAPDYHLIFADWDQSIARQSAALDRLIRAHTWDQPPLTLLDCSCGIGTQALGLAARGYRVHATDLSAPSVRRAAAEAERRGLALTTGVADLRALGEQVTGQFDVVLSCDNALPHLLTDADLLAAARAMRDRLRPGGLVLISIRDYDYYQDQRAGQGSEQRTNALPPQVMDDERGRRMVFQVWDWSEDGQTYTVTLFLVQSEPPGYRTRHYTTTYRALRRSELNALLAQAGLDDIRWHMPQDTGYHQPIVTARA